MDIPVSRLNQRMALQLPAELPLGLVFVVGEVQLPAADAGESEDGRRGEFYLEDQGYRLPCRLSERATAEFRLEAGDMVRAGGHLVFEPVLASYYLLARDIERLDGFRPAAKPLAAIIADNSRREQANALAPAELPTWVQQMAPPEVSSTPVDHHLAAGLAAAAPQLNGDWELLADTEAAVAYPEAEPALAGLSDELIAFLSNAMDSEVEVEITSEIMTDLNDTGTTERLSPEVLAALDHFEASMSQEAPVWQAVQPQPADAAESPADSLFDQLVAWIEPDEALVDASDEQAAEETITAAEVAAALESTEQADPVADVAEEKPQPAPTAATKKRRTARKSESKDTIPWYLALFIIVIFAAILALLVYLAMFPDGIPADISLDFPLELPLIN